ncbi:MAG TPA: glycosyltransferase family 39 protein, partial [Deltaproteobacteria bacterium]|nr:glycosyltransferase family 39 protein [Deltaproteobacteria bacterium]
MDRKKLLIGLLFLALFLVPGLRHGLWLPDEPRVAGICSEMVRTGDYIVPHLNGRAFLEKPPLYFAVAALFGSLVDTDSEVPYRLASLLFSVLTILLTFGMTNTRHGVIAGLMAGGILASSWEFFKISRWIL